MVTKSNRPSKFVRLGVYPVIGLIFVLIVVFVLTLATGYKFFYNNGRISFQKTGMIIINTKPANADVYIDGKYSGKSTTLSFLSVQIPNLKPGKHTLVIKKSGFLDWKKEIEVKPSLVSWANYALLIPTDLKIEKNKSLDGLNIVATSKNNHYLLLSKKDKNNETNLFVYDINNSDLKMVWPTNKSLPEAWLNKLEIVSGEFNNNGRRALLRVKNGLGTELVVLDSNKIPAEFIYRLSQTKLKFDKILWNPQNQNELIALSGHDLYRLSLEGSGQIGSSIRAKDVVDFTTENNNNVLYVQETKSGNILGRMQTNGNNKVIYAGSVEKSSSYIFAYSSQKDVLALLPAGTKTLTVYYKLSGEKSSLQLEKNVFDMKWSKDGTRIVYYNDQQALVFDWTEMKEKTIDTVGQIQNIDWYYDENHLITKTNKEVFIMDFDGENQIKLMAICDYYFLYNQSSIFFEKKENGQEVFYNLNLNF